MAIGRLGGGGGALAEVVCILIPRTDLAGNRRIPIAITVTKLIF
jgi:hypothetical protein